MKDEFISVNASVVTELWQSHDNYLIEFSENGKVERDLCAIYFSSNGIYFPNTANTFYHALVEKNRFEWYGNRIKRAYKHIFVRDVYKQWYVKGISQKIPSSEALVEWLKKECKGYKVITLGSSAGGYAAVLFGAMIGAELQLAFSPQVSIESLLDEERDDIPLLYKEYEYNDVSRYICRAKHLYFFYSKYSLNDMNDIKIVQREKGNIVMFNNDVHGVPFKEYALPSIINMDNKHLDSLVGKVYSPLFFSLRYISWQALSHIALRIIRKVLKLFVRNT